MIIYSFVDHNIKKGAPSFNLLFNLSDRYMIYINIIFWPVTD